MVQYCYRNPILKILVLFRKLIPDPPDRMKVLWVTAILFKEFPEVENEVVNGTGGRIYVVAPYYL